MAQLLERSLLALEISLWRGRGVGPNFSYTVASTRLVTLLTLNT